MLFLLEYFSRSCLIFNIGVGDGIPTVVAHKRKVLDIYTDINGKKDVKFSTRRLETDTWYDVRICQKPSEDNPRVVCKESLFKTMIWFLFFQYLFEVRVDDVQEDVSSPIKDPETHIDVDAYACYERCAESLIRNPFFNPNPDGTIKVEG